MRKDIPLTHKARLRAQLLAHADDHLKKKKRSNLRYLPLVAVPALALAVFVVTSLWQPLDKSTNPVAQQVAGPLTAQKVFAEAIKQISDQRTLGPGEYYYTRSIDDHLDYGRDYTGRPPGSTCIRSKVYVSMYLNEAGKAVRMERADRNNKLFQVATMSEDGRSAGDKFFYDTAISDANDTPVACPPISNAGTKKPSVFQPDEYQKSPAGKVQAAIESGNPTKQKEALETLKTIDEFKIAENQRIDGYGRPVITMSTGEMEGRIVYYFDQETKAFVGMESHERDKSIILEQGIRKLPTNDPPEYTRPSPPQM